MYIAKPLHLYLKRKDKKIVQRFWSIFVVKRFQKPLGPKICANQDPPVFLKSANLKFR